jgi:hypothetical protein
LVLVALSENSPIKSSNSAVIKRSAFFLVDIILPPATKDFSVIFSNISINLFSLPRPGVINPLFSPVRSTPSSTNFFISSSSTAFVVVPVFLTFLISISFKILSALCASSSYLTPLKPIFPINLGIAAPILSALAPVTNPLITSLD